MKQKSTPAERVEEIFTTLLRYPPELRHDQSIALCGDDTELRAEVDSLLIAADQAMGFLSAGPMADAWQGDVTLESSAMIGQRLDSWRILRELNSGGMGVVFLAERVDGHYQQKVAIKLAKLALVSSETANLFHIERQILANLRHPNIAQLLDGGTGPGGDPYLVMEYVQGVAIDTWCDSRHLSVEQAISLLITVCDAVQYAHKNLIVHCDLKPSNILVSEGIPKLLDFGIAKLLHPSRVTRSSTPGLPGDDQSPLTPTFAAPEQLRGEPVTTATDVYAMGVVLYRLLSGDYPYSIDVANWTDIACAVESVEILPPSCRADGKRRFLLQGDLDNIVLNALQKNPQKRYTSMQALSADLQRYLAGYAVSVGPKTWWYRWVKFATRNKWGVSLAVAAVISLWVGSFVSVWQWQLANEKQHLAEQRFVDVRNMINTLVFELPANIASQPGSTKLRVLLLSQGIAELDSLVKNQINSPDLVRQLAVAYGQLARLQGYTASVNLGEPAKAVATYERSLKLQHELFRQQPENLDLIIEIVTNYRALSLINFVALKHKHRAYVYTDKCEKLLQPWVDTGDPRVLRALLGCYTLEAKWHNSDKNYDKARESLAAAEELVRTRQSDQKFWTSHNGYRLRSRMHEEWAEIESHTGSMEAALGHETKRLEITLNHLQNDSDRVSIYGPARITGDGYHAYGARLRAVGKLTAAEEAYEQAIRIWTDVGERYPEDFSVRRSLVFIYADLAELHRQIANSRNDETTVARRKKLACDSYRSSIENVNKMMIESDNIPSRYTWSPMPTKTRQRYEAFCLDAG